MPYVKDINNIQGYTKWKSEGYSVHISEKDPKFIQYLIDKSTPTYQDLRKSEYPSTDDLIVALWEDTVESRPDAKIALQELRAAVKIKYPKV